MDEQESPDSDKKQSYPSQSIIAKFGSTIQNVTQIINNQIDEKILKRLGFEQRIGFLLVYGFVTVAVVSLFFGLKAALLPKSPVRMAGTYNIAVAAFETHSSDIFHEEDGVQIGNWLVQQLLNQEPSFPKGTNIDIWGPEQVGVIAGESNEDRAAEAQRIAEKIGAHIVIYGSLQSDNSVATANPEFYVAIANFELAQELTGSHRLGTPIPISGELFQNPVLGAGVNRELNGRTLALAYFTIGMIYFELDDYEQAYHAFEEAEKIPDWESQDGKEVVYLFLGNTALGFKNYETANTWFQEAIANNPNYARAYIGYGYSLFQQAIVNLADDGTVDLGLMDQAINAFKQGLIATDKPSNADIDAKGHFGLGRAYLTLSNLGEADLWAESKSELLYVTEAYEAGQVNLQELAAQAYGNLGLLNYALGAYDDAIHAFEQALEIGCYPEFKAEWADWLSRIYQERGDENKAAEYKALAESFSK
jgi:tetratricopeptide (TPR) repeat protein